MQRSSETIGAVAGALAKAQAELTNPEKSLVATIRSPFPREGDRTFRYASLSSGLDIVRKALSKHEIATVQTTSIDNEAGLVRLTTVLAHSSGEWLSSEWPVCPVGDTAAPHKMGAALTYARRYALFTLVGIAGEDDLDAPDLPGIKLDSGTAGPIDPAKMNGHAVATATHPSPSRRRGPYRQPAPSAPILDAEASAALRDKLTTEIATLGVAEVAVEWARRSIAAKNTLTAEDAGAVESAFRDRMQALEALAPDPEPPTQDLSDNLRSSPPPPASTGPDGHSSGGTRPMMIEPQKGVDQRGIQLVRQDRTHRQERPCDFRTSPLSQQRASPVRRTASMSRMWTNAFRSSPPAFYATACARPQGERRIRCSAVQEPSPRGPSGRR